MSHSREIKDMLSDIYKAFNQAREINFPTYEYKNDEVFQDAMDDIAKLALNIKQNGVPFSRGIPNIEDQLKQGKELINALEEMKKFALEKYKSYNHSVKDADKLLASDMLQRTRVDDAIIINKFRINQADEVINEINKELLKAKAINSGEYDHQNMRNTINKLSEKLEKFTTYKEKLLTQVEELSQKTQEMGTENRLLKDNVESYKEPAEFFKKIFAVSVEAVNKIQEKVDDLEVKLDDAILNRKEEQVMDSALERTPSIQASQFAIKSGQNAQVNMQIQQQQEERPAPTGLRMR